MRWLSASSILAVASSLVFACASDEGETGSSVAGSGGQATGGSGGSSDGAAASGSSGAAGEPNDCVHTGPPLIDPATLPVCPLCEGARCVAKALVPADQVDQLADCDDGSKCVPDEYIAKVGKFVLPTCTSLLGNEGRCVSTCLPEIAAQADRLPKDVCGDNELCAPCFDPTTGEETGACRVSCDTGPTQPPILFSECCAGLGSCVPEAMVPADQKAQVNADGCGSGELCAPKILASGAQPATCSSIGGAEGRCLPECLPAIAAQADKLSQDTCQAGELCAPCYDPLSGAPTGSCSINGDTPAGPPTTFAACCSGLGSCVPKSLVPAAQQSMLGSDVCTDPNTLCVPTELATAGAKPSACASLGGAEGRCLPKCLPAIAAQAGKLPQSTCAATHVCAPCYDPLAGSATGSCALNGDAPSQPPFVFPKCCGYQGSARGTCIPTEILSSSQIDSLPKDSCPSDAWRCVPNLKVQNPSAKFPYCQASGILGGSQPGACVPDCLVSGFESFFVGQGSCKAGEKCAPCQKPFGGSSGACD